MRSFVRSVVVLGACVAATACNQKNRSDVAVPLPTSPGPASPPGTPLIFRIVSGPDQMPVRGAAVSIDGDDYVTDSDGYFTFAGEVGPRWGAALDVDAPGFLPRRTKINGARVIGLWPVASDAEADAVRAMVYQRGGPQGEVLFPPAPGAFYVTLEGSSRDVSLAWAAEASAFGAIFGLSYELSASFQYETNETLVLFDSAPAAPCTPIAVSGFCRDPNMHYKIFRVLPEKATDPETMRRVLASWFLGPNPLPGLLNGDAPAASLSPLEMQTIRMILQRPLDNRWPDSDR